MSKAKLTTLMNRLEKNPDLLKRVESILDIVENKYDDMERADDVEECVISEMQKLGHNVIEGWAKNPSTKKSDQFSQSRKGRKDTKKN